MKKEIKIALVAIAGIVILFFGMNFLKGMSLFSDKNVYFVDGKKMFGKEDRDMCTVDGSHPNDLGFLRMADMVEPVLRGLLYPQK